MIARHRLLGVAILFALLLAACGPAGGPVASPSATKGGTLTFAIWQEPNTLHPYYGTQTVISIVLKTVVEGLTRPDAEGNYIPVLASETPTVKNGGVKLLDGGKKMDVTYKLLPDVKWSDGEPVTSADVQFTWQSIMKDPSVTTRAGYDLIESIDTPDAQTAVMHFREVYAAYAGLFERGLLPKHLLAGVADVSKTEFVRKPLGTGPFKITEFVSADHITAERNPNYRLKDRPLLDRIIFRSVPSREVAVAQLKAGEVDGMWNLLEAQLTDLERNPDIKVLSVIGPSVERLEFNLARPANPADPSVPHPVLGDLAMRQALLLATPKKQIIDKLLFGKASVGTSPLPIGWASSKDAKQEDYDPKKAKQILDQAGWVPGPDGVRVKGGVPARVTIRTTSGDKVREQVEVILQNEWKEIGVKLEINNVPSSVLFGSWSQNAARKRGNFDINMYASSYDADPHAEASQRFQSKFIPRPDNNGAGFNYNRFSNAEVDRLIEQAGSSVDPDVRKKAYAQVFKIVNDNILNVWLYNRADLDAFRSSVGGYKGNPWDRVTVSAADWFVRR